MNFPPNPGGHFKFKIGQRVIYRNDLDPECPRRVRIHARTIEAGCGKVYLIKDSKGRSFGHTPENQLSSE